MLNATLKSNYLFNVHLKEQYKKVGVVFPTIIAFHIFIQSGLFYQLINIFMEMAKSIIGSSGTIGLLSHICSFLGIMLLGLSISNLYKRVANPIQSQSSFSIMMLSMFLGAMLLTMPLILKDAKNIFQIDLNETAIKIQKNKY